jgi:transcriptional regulator with XRE-family HTH domain
MEIGDRLKMVRKLKGLSLGKLAALTGLSKGNLSSYENNKTNPSVTALVPILKHLGVNINWLLTGEGEIFNCNNKEDNAEIKKRLAEAEEELRQLRLQYASLQDQNEELNQEIKDRLRQIVGLQEKLIPQN